MKLPARTPAFAELVPPGGQLTRLCTGFRFTEGPVWSAVGGYLLFSDMPGDVRRRWNAVSGVTEVRRPSNKCNGMTYDAQGNLLVCEHVTSSVVRERPDGSAEVVASHFQGRELNSPNDLVVSENGSVYFTDPTYGRTAEYGRERAPELPFRGVFLVRPGAAEPVLLLDDFGQPNGLCFSPGESVLYVNDTQRAHIRAFDVCPDGTLSGGRVFCSGIGTGRPGDPNPDGMKCDERGNVFVTGPGGVWIISPGGEPLGVIEVPEKVGNMNWGGHGWRSLFICASTSVYRIELNVAGHKLGYMRRSRRPGPA